MSKLLGKIEQIADRLSTSQIDEAIAILNSKKESSDEQEGLPVSATETGLSASWIEEKEINGHGPYKYKRWQEKVKGPTPEQSRMVTRSKYLGKA